ncbi:500_t:CDS:2 [Ambispora leptoticha]|uniref:BLOC-1-related complex subunit 5 n=1 Tax=Ambispora leptoticha TaxID=144679 RepID=A0A9N9ED47_9GLOM|nr:500_t:CDS:2 [Ambispora leptoticha]
MALSPRVSNETLLPTTTTTTIEKINNLNNVDNDDNNDKTENSKLNVPDTLKDRVNIDSKVPDIKAEEHEESLKSSHIVIESEDSHSLSIKRDIEKGVITLPSVNNEVNDLDPEMIKLDQIPKFEPLLKPNLENTGYSFSSLWGGSTFFRHESMFKIAALFQSHTRQYAEEVCEDQRVIIDTVKSVDEYCAQISQSMIAAQLQAKVNLEQIGIVNSLMKQVEKTHLHIHETFQTLNKLDKLLSVDMQLGGITASERWPTIQKLFVKTRPKPAQHGGSFQFETKRLSLQQRRTHPSAVAVTFDTVLCARHQDVPLPDSLTPEKQQQPIIIKSASSSMQQQHLESENNTSSQVAEQITTASSYSSSPWSISLSPIREGLKRVGSSTGIDTLLWPSSPASTQNSNSSNTITPTTTKSVFTTSQSSSGTDNKSSSSNNSINKSTSNVKALSPSSASVSLLTAMLRKSTSLPEDRKKMKSSSSKDPPKKLTPDKMENKATSAVSSSSTELTPPTRHTRTSSESSNMSNNSSDCDEIYMKSSANKLSILNPSITKATAENTVKEDPTVVDKNLS